MYEISFIALIVLIVIVYRQGQRLKLLEADFATLRGMVAAGVPAQAASQETAQTPEARNLPEEAEGEPMADEPLPAAARDDAATDAGDEDGKMVWPWAATVAQEAAADKAAGEAELVSARDKSDIETALGTRWAVWVGGIALALGGIFLVRYSIEAGIFGPGVRLTFAAIFGLALAGVGEFARRHGFATPVGGIDSAYIPSILTAAAAFILFGVVFAAHGIYGFIGPASAFVLLGLIGLATIAASLIHGQALAGLGLLGSYLTPVLVSSEAPSPWSLFIYLAIVLVAAVAIASFRRWRFLSVASYVGAGLWSLVYLLASPEIVALPVFVLHIAGLAALAGLWLARGRDQHIGRADPAAVAAGIFTGLVALMLALDMPPERAASQGHVWAFLLFIALLAAAAWRRRAVPLLHAAGVAFLFVQLRDILAGSYHVELWRGSFSVDAMWPGPPASGLFFTYASALGAIFLAAGIVMSVRTVMPQRYRAAMWAFWAATVPFAVLFTTWLGYGNLDIDWRYAAIGLVLALLLVAGSEVTARAEDPPYRGGWAVSLLLAGAALAFAYVLLAGFGSVLTTVLTGLAAAIPAAATKLRRYRCLGWISAGFAAIVLARAGIEPTVAGWEFLGTTPVFNALLPGYLVPALAFAYAAWQLARTTNGRPRYVMEAFAALFALLGVAMLVRHAMNGGVIDAGEPFLAEQSIYTLVFIGAGGILLALDRRSPSPVFQWGSMAAGVISVFLMASAHFLALNPLFTNESTGTIPFVNLLLLAYLLPGIGMIALAWYARGKRPQWYVSMLAAAAALLAFAYVTLSVRRIFQGEFIGSWKGLGGPENYTYSAVWLALGVALLVAGIRFRSRVLRLASACMVVLAVAKVFVFDMSELEGVLRAVSFMGLGIVLIGIGMFYQRMLVAAAK